MPFTVLPTHDVANAGAALSGCGFALVFPAFGVEAVKAVADQDLGPAPGVYTDFLDLAMGVTGPDIRPCLRSGARI
jgi:hypothetical protein